MPTRETAQRPPGASFPFAAHPLYEAALGGTGYMPTSRFHTTAGMGLVYTNRMTLGAVIMKPMSVFGGCQESTGQTKPRKHAAHGTADDR